MRSSPRLDARSTNLRRRLAISLIASAALLAGGIASQGVFETLGPLGAVLILGAAAIAATRDAIRSRQDRDSLRTEHRAVCESARIAADEAARTRDQFLHELRTQLHNFEAATTLLRESELHGDQTASAEVLERTVESTLAAVYQFEDRCRTVASDVGSSAPSAGIPRIPGRALLAVSGPRERDELSELLSRLGLDVLEVDTAARARHELAVQQVATLRFSVLITGSSLSDMHGLELCSRVHQEWGTGGPVTVVLRDRAEQLDPAEVERAHVGVVLPRPIALEPLAQALLDVLPKADALGSTALSSEAGEG